MRKYLSRHRSWLLLAILFPSTALAHDGLPRHIHIGTLGVNMTLTNFSENLIGLLAGSVTVICTVLFLLGAFYLVISRGKQDQMQKGKDLMIGSLIGVAVTLGSYAIIQTLFSVIY